jgi:hypothetical protein
MYTAYSTAKNCPLGGRKAGHTKERLGGFEADKRGAIAENIIPNKESSSRGSTSLEHKHSRWEDDQAGRYDTRVGD